ncbi:MAG: hypothetical protein HRU20_08490 [Pseudomonadales bacterium]|nr:hypothetical protein [Pseudomonadales bacterium]
MFVEHAETSYQHPHVHHQQTNPAGKPVDKLQPAHLAAKHQRQLHRLHQAIQNIEDSIFCVDQRLKTRYSDDHAHIYEQKNQMLNLYRSELLKALTQQ